MAITARPANWITGGRIALTLVLLFLTPFTPAFYTVYILCGAGDMLDGPVARFTHTEGPSGAKLDSLADLLFLCVMTFVLASALTFEPWMLVWIAVVAAIRAASLLAGLIQYRTAAFLHTTGNKAAGLLLFCAPLLYPAAGLPMTFVLAGVMAALSAGEELLILLTSQTPQRDGKGLGGSLKTRRLTYAVLYVFGVLLAIAVLLYHGELRPNRPSKEEFPVRGVDVSAYQGEIDWTLLASQDIHFAFIKATEGSRHTDPRFQRNFEDACKTGLRVGAYHFFSFDSSGDTQADHFIAAVPKTGNMLPPVVDVEFYGSKAKDPPQRQGVQAQLSILLERLEAHYGQKPILYATGKAYQCYIAGSYPDYDIWSRDMLTRPRLPDGREWTFWQYTDRGRLEGYRGEEPHIDMNVFHGTWAQFMDYPNEGGK